MESVPNILGMSKFVEYSVSGTNSEKVVTSIPMLELNERDGAANKKIVAARAMAMITILKTLKISFILFTSLLYYN